MTACGTSPLVHPVAQKAEMPLRVRMQLPEGVWTWVPIEGAQCGDGSPTGIAVSAMADSNTLLVFFEGGGACYNDETCRQVTTTSYISGGYTQSTFENVPVERDLLENGWMITNRARTDNPFRNANMAYFPYCTGDLHAGDNVITYPGAPKPIYHVGMRNTRLYFKTLAAQLPQLESVWLSGFSAGGFGSAFHRDTAQEAFTAAQINIIDDSGMAYAGTPQKPSWNIHYPEGCPTCDTDFSTIMDYYAATAPGARYGFLSYTTDSILPLFFGQPTDTVAQGIANFATRTASTPNLHVFYALGDDHVVLQNPLQSSQGTTLSEWINQMVGGSPTWSSRVPFAQP